MTLEIFDTLKFRSYDIVVNYVSSVQGAAEKGAVVPCHVVPVAMVVIRHDGQEVQLTIMTDRRRT